MQVPKKPVFYMLLFSAIILFIIFIMQPLTILGYKENIALLFPKGLIAIEQRNLLLIIQALMLLVIIPVYILTFVFSWKYRAHNTKAVYDPDLIDSRLAEYIWWGVPIVMTLIISVLTYIKTHELDPFKPIASDKKPITIQVVALQWKWLFLYPEENIATLNFVQFPEKTPIHFEITADAPMNSFWIPKLGGQIYAMPNMKTELNLIADESGDFTGVSANLSGEGFAGMKFTSRASSDDDYKKWIETAKGSPNKLSMEEYTKLVLPSSYNPIEIYGNTEPDLFDKIINKFMHPKNEN